MASNVNLSDTAANAAANAIAPLLNSGFLEIYSGTQPENANTAPSGGNTLLATLTFAATAFGSATAGEITANAIGSATATASGTATWFRCYESDAATAVVDGTVGTSGCDMNMNSVAIASGATVSVTSLTLTITE